MTGGRRLPALTGLAAVLVVALAPDAATTAASTAAARTATAVAPGVNGRGQIDLLGQTFDVAANGVLTIDLLLADEVVTATDTKLVVTAHRPIERRAQVAEASDGVLTRTADSVDLDLEAQIRLPGGGIRAVIPVERSARTAAALQLSRPGLYPVVVEVTRRGDVIADLITFVHRLPDADEEDEQPIRLALVMTATRPVRMVEDSLDRAIIDDGTLADLDRLADSLEASAVPIAVGVPPAVAEALVSDDAYAPLAERLAELLTRHRVLAAPLWPLSPSQAADVDLASQYGRWLRDGEDALADLVGSPPSRTTLVVDEQLTAGGATLLRDLGTRLLLLPANLYDVLPGSLGTFTDTTQLVQLAVARDSTIDALVVDRELDSRLAATTSRPLLAAIEIIADIVAAREEIALDGGASARHGMLLAAPGNGIIPAALLGPLSELLAESPAVDVMTVDEMATTVDRLLIDGTEVVVPLADGGSSSTASTLVDRLDRAASIALGTASVGSMLDEDDPRPAEWQRRLELLPTSAISDERAATIVGEIAGELDDIRASVVLPDGFSFTLTGRSTEIPVKLFNRSTEPLRVVVRLTSTKLLFPDAPTEVVLEPGVYTEVLVPVEARTNGRFPVTLEVVTPTGLAPIGEPVTLSAGVNALRGLGPLLTGAFLLVVLSWWGRHVQHTRRRRFAAAHPSGRHADSPAGEQTLRRSEATTEALTLDATSDASGDQR